MNDNNSPLVMRAGWGKAIGFLIGLFGVIVLVSGLPEIGARIWLGILFYSITLGLIVGVLSVDIKHPLFPWELKWWFVGTATGAWMTFVLMLFIGDGYEDLLSATENALRHFASPLWLTLDGAVAGFIVSAAVHRIVGDP